MIIKSLSRKKPSFEQLYDYMLNGADDKEILITRNLLKYNDKESVINQFDKNYNLLTKRKNTNALYHEIISLPHQKNMDIKKQKEIIQDLANQYLDNRTNNNLCFGVIHEEKEHLHCHLMISSNAKGSYTRHRLARAEFNEIRREVERYKLEKFFLN